VTCGGTARLWDLTAKDPGTSPVVLRGHEGAVHKVAISSDRHWLVTGSEDKTARLWDLTAKDPGASPDNRWVVTGSGDQTARLWLLQANDLMNLARITVGRNFSADEWRLYFPGEKYRKTFPDLPEPD
jgi:WD40 repeat protein